MNKNTKMKKPKKQNKYLLKCYKCLRVISLGKISLGLYYRNSLQYGSTFGGMFTLFLAFLLFVYSGFIFLPLIDGSGITYNYYTNDISTLFEISYLTNRVILPKITALETILTDVTNYNDDYC